MDIPQKKETQQFNMACWGSSIGKNFFVLKIMVDISKILFRGKYYLHKSVGFLTENLTFKVNFRISNAILTFDPRNEKFFTSEYVVELDFSYDLELKFKVKIRTMSI